MSLIRNCRFSLLSAILFLAPVFSFTSSGYAGELKSAWREREIQIDGNKADWEGFLTFPDDKPLGVGLVNDENSLYLCLTSTDRSILRQAIMNGLTIWFEPEGGKNKFGIRFPVGVQRDGMQRMNRDGPPDSTAMDAMRAEATKEMQIIGPKKNDTLRATNFISEGIEVKLSHTPERFVYELKVALDKTGQLPHAVAFGGKKPVKIRLETGKMERPEFRREGGFGGRPPGGGGFPGGGRPGGGMRGGMRGPGGMREMMEPFEWSAKIYLAENNSGEEEK